ncbi:ATP-binding protein [Desulfobotulus mexicanus]|uniref:ATP-binding protein n=1 Tax=Desulfobotulus mexicanus TaxID=2586642 RepID=A0A5S5MDU9_9BACT|nr:ATP-binding protein [Desulfobotulus mexicanus]TYT73860.1 ATP-binding protein [Desulfobotulus mexicanus]
MNPLVKGYTGLGLFLSKRLVLAHGGHIYAENCDKGGAVFGFCLPMEE